jgi:disulfide oxidoreductase YuzD
MNTNTQPLLALVEKLMSKDYVKSPICGICFEFSKEKSVRVFTAKTVRDQFENEFFEMNEVDLTLTKFTVPKQRSAKVVSTLDPVNQFLKTKPEPLNYTIIDIVSETEHAVLINELVRTKYLINSEVISNDYEAELSVRFSKNKLSYGYIGIHPYTKKYEKTENGTKMYISIYWGIKQFTILDPDAEKIPINKIGM